MAKDDKKAVFDVSKPGSTPPDSSSKPIIVSHKPMIKDPMMQEEAAVSEVEETEKISSTPKDTGKVIEPLSKDSDDNKEEPKKESEEKPPEEPSDDKTSDDKEKDEVDPKSGDSADSAVVDAVLSQAEQKGKKSKEAEALAEREAANNKLIESKKYFVKIKQPKRRRNKRMLLTLIFVILLGLVGVGLAADAELIDINVPFDFIKKSAPTVEQTAPVTESTDKETDGSANEVADQYVIPDGYVVYENKDLGFKFTYPKEWGDAKLDKSPESEHLIKGEEFQISFSANENVTVGGATKDREHDPNLGHGGFTYAAGFTLPGALDSQDSTTTQSEFKDAKSSIFRTVFMGISCEGAGTVMMHDLGETQKYPTIAFLSYDYKADASVEQDPNCTAEKYLTVISGENLSIFQQINPTIQVLN